MLYLGLLQILGASATVFRYDPPSLRRSDSCSLCYDDDCIPMERTRCEYYGEVELVDEEDPPEINFRTDIDDIMTDLVETASELEMDCMPLISAYTNCNKENACTHCSNCICDSEGEWQCKTQNQCRTETTVVVDHRVLTNVLQSLNNVLNNVRSKRSIKSNDDKIKFEDIAEWMYDVKIKNDSSDAILADNDTADAITDNQLRIPNVSSETDIPINATNKENQLADYIAFDEVLNNAVVKKKKKVLPVQEHNETEFDYMNIDENTDLPVVNNPNIDTIDIVKGYFENEPKIVVDLLQSAKERIWELNNTTPDTENTIQYLDNILNGATDVPSKVAKRNVVLLNNETVSTTRTDVKDNKSVSLLDLQKSVLKPLNDIIEDKEKELDKLTLIKEKLLSFLNSCNFNQSNYEKNRSNFESSMAIYKIDVTDESDMLRNNPDSLDKHTRKLKNDMYAVIRDVMAIRQMNSSIIPENLKMIFNAMKHYIQNNNKINTRRKYKYPNETSFKTLIVKIIKMLKILDKNVTTSNALANVPKDIKNIALRIVKGFSVNELSHQPSEFTTPYNLTNNLRNIGITWEGISKTVEDTPWSNKLYAMKLLHINLVTDIKKMNNALALIEFAETRRMEPIEGKVGNDIIDKIAVGLNSINEKIQTIIKLHKKTKILLKNKTDSINKKKKMSFFNKLKNILRTSKKDIADLMKKKVPKADIVKEIAKKRLDDLSKRRVKQFEDTMRKWQNNMNIVSRDKRSMEEKANYMKTIIPKYLRGKIKPEMLPKSKLKSKKSEKISSSRKLSKSKH